MQEFDIDRRQVALPEADDTFPRVLWLIEEPPSIRMLLDVTTGLRWFDGHFPGQPILPGIVELHWAVVVSHALFGFSGPPEEVRRLKFSRVVIPPRELRLSLSRHGSRQVQFEFRSRDEQNAVGRLVFLENATC